MIEGIEKIKSTELLDGIYKLYHELIEGARSEFKKNTLTYIINSYIWGDGRPSCIRDGGVYESDGGYRVELLVENDYQHINEKIHLYFNIDKEIIRDNIIDKILK